MQDKRPDSYWVTDPEQLEALISARRHDIVDRLAGSEALSIRELARQIGAQPSALYHHVRKLLAVGLITEAGSRVVRRKREQLYTTPAPRMRLSRALADPGHSKVMAEIAASLTRQMSRDVKAGAKSRARVAEGEERNYGFSRLVGRPTPAQLARINACLLEIAEILWKSGDSAADPVCVGWVIAPLDVRDTEGR